MAAFYEYLFPGTLVGTLENEHGWSFGWAVAASIAETAAYLAMVTAIAISLQD